MRDDKKQRRHIMAEAIFASKEIKEFTARKRDCAFRLFLAIVARLAKYFFMSYGPCDTGDRNGQNKQPRKLKAD